MRIYATGARQLLLPLGLAFVLCGLIAIWVPWPLALVAFLLITGYAVLVVRRTWVHVAPAGVAWRTPRRLAWATPTGSAVRSQIQGFSVVSEADGRIARLSLVDGSTVTLPLRETVQKPQPRFGQLTRELAKLLPHP